MAPRRDTAGSSLELNADRSSTRRYVQCPCGAREVYRDAPSLWAAQWGSTWDTDRDPPRRIWACPDCWVPPRLSHAPPSWRLSAQVLDVASRPKNSRARRSLHRAVARLLD